MGRSRRFTENFARNMAKERAAVDEPSRIEQGIQDLTILDKLAVDAGNKEITIPEQAKKAIADPIDRIVTRMKSTYDNEMLEKENYGRHGESVINNLLELVEKKQQKDSILKDKASFSNCFQKSVYVEGGSLQQLNEIKNKFGLSFNSVLNIVLKAGLDSFKKEIRGSVTQQPGASS